MRAFAIGLIAVAAVLAAVPAAADVKAGVDAWARGDFDRAVEEWRGPAVAGDADAQFNLGQAYKLGRGVPLDPALAESWFRKAALLGHRQSEDNYGLALFTADKKADALPWLEQSVARFEPRAMLVLGTMLFNGDGVKRDPPRGYALMMRASAAGLESASQTLAQMDQYIAAVDRERGVVLARQYEAQSRAMPAMAGASPTRVGEASSRKRVTSPMRDVSPPPPIRATTPPAPGVAPASARGGWRVQLGAFRERANAEALWRQVSARMRGAAPSYVEGGGVSRLQVGGYPTKAAATSACTSAKAAGAPCMVVAP